MSEHEFLGVAGEDSLVHELDNGIRIVYRPPTSQEIVNYKNSIGFRRKGKTLITKAAEQQLKLAEKIMTDIMHYGYRDKTGKVQPLNNTTKLEDIAHIKPEGAAPRTWKDLVPALYKIQFIEGVMAGIDGAEKNE
jgi:hypothetical protein